MIRKLIGTAVVLLIGAGLMYYALGHHFVKASTGSVTVPKASLTLSDTWVDIREWTAADFKEHPEVTKALIDNGHGDLVVQSATDGVIDWIKDKTRKVLE
ncbi:MAG: hypothetical protein GC159_01665 [Phycisphaera sp.]|nr:hypothetical protein [Phycisphaera sp.]